MEAILSASPEPVLSVEITEMITSFPVERARPMFVYVAPMPYEGSGAACFGIFLLFMVSMVFAILCRGAREPPQVVQAQPILIEKATDLEKA